jgi:hypothetical protein
MVPTLLVISFLVFVVIQAPPGSYLSLTWIANLLQGDMACSRRHNPPAARP